MTATALWGTGVLLFTIVGTAASAANAQFACPRHGQAEPGTQSGSRTLRVEPKSCRSPSGCSPGYSCTQALNMQTRVLSSSVYICCKPSTRAIVDHPNCGHKGFNYYPFGEPEKPLECRPGQADSCPTVYKCLACENQAQFPNAYVCCLEQTNPFNKNSSSAADPCPPIGNAQVLCKNLAIPHHDVFGLDDTKCKAETGNCGPDGPVYQCEKNPSKTTEPLCCPVYGKCPNGVEPEKLKNGRVVNCDILGQKDICSDKSYSCQSSDKGWIVCCPDQGQCPGNTRPLYESGKPKSCNFGATGSSACPKTPQEYKCTKGTLGQSLCCPVLGDCLPGYEPYPKNNPQNCTIPHDFNMDTGCPKKTGVVCHISTTGHSICCLDLDESRR